MNVLTGSAVPRRTFLRGVGASVALPFLDAMIPVGRLGARVLDATNRTRLVCIEVVHGSAGSAASAKGLNLWAPKGLGHEFDLGPTSLSPLEPFRDYLTIVSNTDVKMADAYEVEEIGGDHFRSSATFLTQAHPRKTEGSDVYVGQSMDQMFAERFGQDTPIPSMQLCIENVDMAGGCGYGYTCIYTDHISWKSPTEPLPMIRDPRVAFEQLFGSGATPEEREIRRRTQGSILDWIREELGALDRSLGAADRQRMEQYLGSIRELERRIQQTVEHNASSVEREIPNAPPGVPDSFDEHMAMMFDLQLLAFETDMTRVFSLKIGRDGSVRVFPNSGTDTPFHSASHNSEGEKQLRDFATINKYHVNQLPSFLERLASTMDGEESLLDKTAIIYGSPMGNSNVHNHARCPLIFLGGGSGALPRGGVHIKASDGTPMANPMLTLMQGMGMHDVTTFGDSTGRLPFTSTPVASTATSGP